MELAEQRRSRFVAIADRVARAYAPVVHSLALLTFLGWTLTGAAPWQTALLYAIAVLIITCPCALGLAVPAVQVLASGRLMRRGMLLKSATALERFAEADMVVFDKTGTLDRRAGSILAADGSTPADARGRGRHGQGVAPSAGARAGGGGTDVPVAAGVEEIAGLRPAAGDGPRANGASGGATGPRAWPRTMRSAPSCGWRGPAARRCASASPTRCASDAGRGGGRAAATRLRGGAAVGRPRADGAAGRRRARHRRLARRLHAGRQDRPARRLGRRRAARC